MMDLRTNCGRYANFGRTLFRNFRYSVSLRPYSDLLFVSDGADWSLSWDVRELVRVAGRLGIRTRSSVIPFGLPRQAVFFSSKSILNHPRRYLLTSSRIGFPYFHGYPDSGDPGAVKCFKNLKRFHHKICRIQVSHSRMRDVILGSGIDPYKVSLIPIGINMDFFQRQTPESRRKMRDKYGIPQYATVIGSFQKDGNGWGEGNTPKMIKGPDVFLGTVKILREKVADIFVLLSGPSRGFVRKGLDRLEIPYKHIYLKEYPQIGELYQCPDVYIVASRDEGGPKAVFESMASGIPLVTTRVGQAMDMVQHGVNGWIVDVEDAEGLAYYAEKAITDTTGLQMVLENGFRTAQSNTYESQRELWKDFFQGFVEMS